MIDAIESLKISFRTQWLRNFKHFGLEINQIRLAGLAERYQELARVIDEFTSGKENSIPALDVEINPAGLTGFHYRHIATGNFFI